MAAAIAPAGGSGAGPPLRVLLGVGLGGGPRRDQGPGAGDAGRFTHSVTGGLGVRSVAGAAEVVRQGHPSEPDGRPGSGLVSEQRFQPELVIRSRQGRLRLARDGETFDGSEEFTVSQGAEPCWYTPPVGERPDQWPPHPSPVDGGVAPVGTGCGGGAAAARPSCWCSHP
ncbi:MAG: hypothetical protein ACRDY5_01315 [Acidimicrobiales bacterium]